MSTTDSTDLVLNISSLVAFQDRVSIVQMTHLFDDEVPCFAVETSDGTLPDKQSVLGGL